MVRTVLCAGSQVRGRTIRTGDCAVHPKATLQTRQVLEGADGFESDKLGGGAGGEGDLNRDEASGGLATDFAVGNNVAAIVTCGRGSGRTGGDGGPRREVAADLEIVGHVRGGGHATEGEGQFGRARAPWCDGRAESRGRCRVEGGRAEAVSVFDLKRNVVAIVIARGIDKLTHERGGEVGGEESFEGQGSG